jgi:hypothetical protein
MLVPARSEGLVGFGVQILIDRNGQPIKCSQG